jgi:peptide-methionine (S)-S-oxide reductase
MQTAIFGGGCFWCTEAVFQQFKGVHRVVSGYMGGHVENPSYEAICEKQTGHAEVIQIEFDPAVIGYADLLDIFFETHDPTTPNQQGNDIGPQYRSVIFALTPDQLTLSNEVIAKIASRESSGWFSRKIVTQVIDLTSQALRATVAGRFWPAEAYHQNYFAQHGHQGYCVFVVAPKVAKAAGKFKALIAQ